MYIVIVCSHCMNWDPFMEEPFFDYDRLDELDLENLPTFEEEVDKKGSSMNGSQFIQ